MTHKDFVRFMREQLTLFEEKPEPLPMLLDANGELSMREWLDRLERHIRHWFWNRGQIDPLGRP